jgi:hypothetical protein
VGQPADEPLFAEIEAHIQSFSSTFYLAAPIAAVRFFFVPFNLSREVLTAHGVDITTWSK